MQTKHLQGKVLQRNGLGDRQIVVRASTASVDAAQDVMVPGGCVSRGNSVPVVLNHSTQIEDLVGRAAITVTQTAVDALITFLPEGVNPKADLAVAAYKVSGAATDVSVGFVPIEYEMIPGKKGGIKYTKWRLIELSCVVVGCNEEAVVIQRSYRGSNRSIFSGGVKPDNRAKRMRIVDALSLKNPPPEILSFDERVAVVSALRQKGAALPGDLVGYAHAKSQRLQDEALARSNKFYEPTLDKAYRLRDLERLRK